MNRNTKDHFAESVSICMICSIGSLILYHWSSCFNLLWQGHEGRFSVYVHASKEKPVHVSRYFLNQDIHSEKVLEHFYSRFINRLILQFRMCVF